ncbi:MarR family winged helix-turn-helix transcriptional regulator [Modestobacter versicolor]|uniref:MarR family winged helix-turn-helix transcriptional regulator n=1 Tax=Modestobacter versicolor TaxID=429133 RepID=UPI0034DFBC5E
MPLHRDAAPGALQTDQYAPAYLALVSNAMSWGTSALLRETFGIGLNDWRVIAALAMRPGLTSGGLTQLLGLTKSVVSRSTTYLAEEGLVGSEESDGARCLYLTDQGLDLYDRVLPTALDRQETLFAGFTQEERSELMGYLLRMYRNLKPSTPLD